MKTKDSFLMKGTDTRLKLFIQVVVGKMGVKLRNNSLCGRILEMKGISEIGCWGLLKLEGSKPGLSNILKETGKGQDKRKE